MAPVVRSLPPHFTLISPPINRHRRVQTRPRRTDKASISGPDSFSTRLESLAAGSFPSCQAFLREDQAIVRNRVKGSRCLQMHRSALEPDAPRRIKKFRSLTFLRRPRRSFRPRRVHVTPGETFRGVTPTGPRALLRGSNRKSYFFFSRVSKRQLTNWRTKRVHFEVA